MNVPKIFSHNISEPMELRTFDKGKLELVMHEGAVVGRATFEPGWKWSESIKPIAGRKSCECAHVSYVLSGRMHVQMDDGTSVDYGPNDIMIIPPGHDAWTIGDEACTVIDFAGMANYAKK
ncbi:MAG: cupin domain-containing protein [Gammaproteobacteria bacterium]